MTLVLLHVWILHFPKDLGKTPTTSTAPGAVLSVQLTAFQHIDQIYGEFNESLVGQRSASGPLMKPAKKTVAIATRLSNISMTLMSGESQTSLAGDGAKGLRFKP